LRVSGRRLGWPLITRETVWCDTPASRATSRMLAGWLTLALVDDTTLLRGW
jgi:hypothetical protein